ncbi:hypothetical protein VCUG_01745 [Vavraia culicis subsp. floridensis]|uniref:Uncharacterized protein n=1 Tax=Vavraia culicis (isolate floridensis) TaxID=948595 RepID=L2GSY5_VAVCU|nr:uncharacterized protein VCUG_01745 [Vavraia culicis subsp. floridensis]ELA46786.1 hypothetical protein VCUG_01745 [Vavraia culicis subsp. floridensis]
MNGHGMTMPGAVPQYFCYHGQVRFFYLCNRCCRVLSKRSGHVHLRCSVKIRLWAGIRSAEVSTFVFGGVPRFDGLRSLYRSSYVYRQGNGTVRVDQAYLHQNIVWPMLPSQL